jgi:hypothetical protein
MLVGRLDEETAGDVLDAGFEGGRWQQAPQDIADIDLLNLSTVGAFLKHVADLDGPDADDDAVAAAFPNLPWWERSVWLPADFEAAPGGGFDTLFVGSAPGLLRDLEAIRVRSPLELGTTPNLYEDMRRDRIAFACRDVAVEYPAYIQWVWLGLYDAATLSLEYGAPMQLS